MNDVERTRAHDFRSGHGVGLVKCRVKDGAGDDVPPTASTWRCETALGTVTLVVCDKCGVSLDVTDYSAW